MIKNVLLLVLIVLVSILGYALWTQVDYKEIYNQSKEESVKRDLAMRNKIDSVKSINNKLRGSITDIEKQNSILEDQLLRHQKLKAENKKVIDSLLKRIEIKYELSKEGLIDTLNSIYGAGSVRTEF